MPLYSDLGIYCAPHLTTPSYYSSPFLGPSARSSGSLGLGLMPLPRLLPSRSSPLMPSIPESGAKIWRGALDRVPSPRYAGPRYLAPKPVRIDTADIDVSSARYAARKERELAAAAAFGDKVPRATIKRGRTVVRLHTQKLKENPSFEARRKMTPGEKLVQKFLIRDKAEEAAKAALRKRIEEKEEAERVAAEITRLRAMEAKTAAIAAATAEASGVPLLTEVTPSPTANENFPTIQGLTENAALDILLCAEEEERKEQEDQLIAEGGEISRSGSTGTVKKRKHGEKDGTVKAAKKKTKQKKEDASGSSSDVSVTDEDPVEKCTLQRRNTVRFRRNSRDVDGFFAEEEDFFPSSRRSSADISPASRRSSVELSPMPLTSEHSPASRRSSVDSSDDTPLASEKKSTVKRKKQKHKIVADVSVDNAEPRSPKFVVDDIKVEESPASPLSAMKKFRYEVIVEDVEAEKAAGRKSEKENKAAAPKKKKDAGKVGKPLAEQKNKAASKETETAKTKTASKDADKTKVASKEAEKTKVASKDADKTKPASKEAEKTKVASKDADKTKAAAKDAEKTKVASKDAEKTKAAAKDADKKKAAAKDADKTKITEVSIVAQGTQKDVVQKSFQNLESSAEPLIAPAEETRAKIESKTEEKAKNLLEAKATDFAAPQPTAAAQPQYKDVKDKHKLEEKLDKLPEETPKDVKTDNKEKSAQAALKRRKIEEEIDATKMQIKELQKGTFVPEKGKPKVEAAVIPKVEDVKVGKRVVEKTKQTKRQADPTPPLTPSPETEDSGVNFWAQLNGMNEEEYAPKETILPKPEAAAKAEVKDEPKKKVKTKPPPLKLSVSEATQEEGEISSGTPQTAKKVTELKTKTETSQVSSPKQAPPPVTKVSEDKPVPKWKQQLKQKETKDESKKAEPPSTTPRSAELPKENSLQLQKETEKVTELKSVPDEKKKTEIKNKDTATTPKAAEVHKDEKQEKQKTAPLEALKSEMPEPQAVKIPDKLQPGSAKPQATAILEKQHQEGAKLKAAEPEKQKSGRPKALDLPKPVEKPTEEKPAPKWKAAGKKEKDALPKVPESPKDVSKKPLPGEPEPVAVPEKKPEEPKPPTELPKPANDLKISSKVDPEKKTPEEAKLSETTEDKLVSKVKDFGKPLDAAKKLKDSKESSQTPKSSQSPLLKTQPTPEEKPVPKWKGFGKQQEATKKTSEPKDVSPKSPESPKESSVSMAKIDATDGPKLPLLEVKKSEEKVLLAELAKSKEEGKAASKVTEVPPKAPASAEQKSPEGKPVPKWKAKGAQEKEEVQKKVPLGKTKQASDEKVPPSPTKSKPEDKSVEEKPSEAAVEEKSRGKIKDPSKDAVTKKVPPGKTKLASGEKTLPATKAKPEAASKVVTSEPPKASPDETKDDVSEVKKDAPVTDKKPVEDKKPPKIAPKTAPEADKKLVAKKQPLGKNKVAQKTPEVAPKTPEPEKLKTGVEKKTEAEETEKKKPEPAEKAKSKENTAEKPVEKGKPKVAGKKPAEVNIEITDKPKQKSTEVKDAKPKHAAKGEQKSAEAKDANVAEVKPKPAEVTVEIKDAEKGKSSAGKGKVAKKSGGKRTPKEKPATPAPPPASDADVSGSSSEEESSSEDDGGTTPRASTTSCSSSDSGFDSRPSSVPVPSTASSEGREPGSPAPPLACSPSLDPYSEDAGLPRSASGRHTPPATSLPRFRKYTVDDFQFLKVLGKGSFGKVLLAELRDTERYYAVKCLKKDVVLEDDDVECTLIERKVLALGTKHPYLCHLFCTFQTESHLLFVMEYLNGGDLMFHIQQSGRFPEPRARFYGAEIVCGLKFLHKKGIVYRDLKLDNILLDFEGHVRIADFGMCKLQIFLERTADTFCGTPDYMAPEIIKGLKYNQCVDWWSFGVLLFEMLVGVSPFSGCDEDELFWSICNEQPQYPRFLSREAHLILTQLLEKDALKRLGTPEGAAGDVCDTAFFRAIDWGAMERRELEPPFRPRVKHALDTQYFDAAFTSEPARLTPIEMSILQSMDQAQFQGFSYTNPNATD